MYEWCVGGAGGLDLSGFESYLTVGLGLILTIDKPTITF